jgi:tetratricopeptide (TPR) repeat protein
MLSFSQNFLSSKNKKFEFSQVPSQLQTEFSMILPPPSKDMDFKDFWVTFLRYVNRHVSLDAALVKARGVIEEYKPREALLSLESIDLSRLAPLSKAIYYCLKGQAWLLLKEYDEEISAFQAAIRFFELGKPLTSLQIIWVRYWLAVALYEQGKVTQSLEELHLCLKGYSPYLIHAGPLRMKVLLNLGHVNIAMGQYGQALDNYGQALSLIQVKSVQEKIDLAGIYWGFGLAYRGKENFIRARFFLDKSLTLFLEAGELIMVTRVRNLLGLVLLEEGELKEAEQTLKEALVTAGALPATKKDYVVLTSASINLAFLFKMQERWPEAQEWATIGLGYAEKLTEPLLVSQVRVDLAEINLRLGRQAEAINLFNLAIATIEQPKIIKGCWQIYYRYGAALKYMGHLQEAVDILSRGYILTKVCHGPCFGNDF